MPVNLWLPRAFVVYGVLLPTYDVLLYIGFFAFLLLFLKEGGRCGISLGDRVALGVLIPLSGFGFALVVTKLVTGERGQTLYLAAVGSVLAGGAYARLRGISLYDVGDAAAPAAAIAFCVMKIGCLISGCCFGVPTEGFLHAVYSSKSDEVLPKALSLNPSWEGVPLVPVQLWTAALALCAFVLSYALLRWVRELPGRRLGVVLGTYAAGRLVIDFWWGGGAILAVGPLIDRQLFGLAMVAMSLYLLFRR